MATATKSSEWTTERLKSLSVNDCLELFRTLEAPQIEEMHGEYAASILDQGSWLKNSIARLSLHNSLTDGQWLTKSFEPLTGNYGRGYNSFDKSGRIVRKYPMKTSIASSRYDGKEVFQLDYTAYSSLLGSVNMVDEIRRIEGDLFLGIGTWGFTKMGRQTPLPFTLSGPAEPYVGVDKEHTEKPARFTS